MKHAEPELFAPTVQLLRHALSLDLPVTFSPDGLASVSKGIPLTRAMNDSCATAEDWVDDETDEGCIFEHGLHLIEYWAKWSVADDYPSPGDQNWRNWAWEFLRRNEQYALLVAWMNGLPEEVRLREEPKADDLLEHVLCEPAPLAGLRTVGNYTEYCLANDISNVIVMPIQVLRYCWGVNWPLAPSDEFINLGPDKQEYFFSVNLAEMLVPDYLAQNELFPEFPFQEVRRIFSNKDVFFKFDLSEPLPGQLEIAREKLQELRCAYYMKSLMSVIDPANLNLIGSDDDLKSISDSKNYTKALLLQLRIFDAVNVNGGRLSKTLCHELVKVFTEEADAKKQDDELDSLPKTISDKEIIRWRHEASKIVNGKYRALLRYKP
ncbi:hypothetical protein ACLS0R_11845 [Comamonas jiangduensis]|uniref:hypothetical protein n=1 Tax=Comamonas jiangduensis TaxID=1194168 RepID=UPI003BF923C3